jgi:hypothetical protein
MGRFWVGFVQGGSGFAGARFKSGRPDEMESRIARGFPRVSEFRIRSRSGHKQLPKPFRGSMIDEP